jgi:DNA modification methylase
VTLLHGDVLEQLATLPDESVHCVVTSPPYWGLRDYGTPGQLGLDPTPDQYIARMVTVFREVRRVLRRDGTCWLNIGDSYAGDKMAGRNDTDRIGTPHPDGLSSTDPQTAAGSKYVGGMGSRKVVGSTPGLKPKDLVGIPWRLAFALQADGWYLRADIIWSKPNPMPESVTDRPTKAHEYVFLLTRSPRYFFDQEAVREPHAWPVQPQHGWAERRANGEPVRRGIAPESSTTTPGGIGSNPAGRNVRSVWRIATEAYPEAHFATFPTELARRCIVAGTSERGCCPECGVPWVRKVDRGELVGKDRGGNYIGREVGAGVKVNPGTPGLAYENRTVGWRPSCDCSNATIQTPGRPIAHPPHRPIPCTVLDPFVGSGTVPHVARLHGRHAIGIDLNADYLELAARRLQQQSLFALSPTSEDK